MSGEWGMQYYFRNWSGVNTGCLFDSYDQVFPYVKDNQVFADAVNRFIPWIRTPEDVVRFLDRWLVFAGIRKAERSVVVYPEGGISYPSPTSTGRHRAADREADAS